MYNKLNNSDWEEVINKYYLNNLDLTIKDYCSQNNLNKSQFYYHRRRLNSKNEKVPVFHAINLGDNAEVIKQETSALNNLLDVTIMIGTDRISIPVSETTLINSIIKELI